MNKKGLISFFQKTPIGGVSFILFPYVKIRLMSLSSRKFYVRGSTLLAQLHSSDPSILYILSTSKGLLTGEEACRLGVGGFMICYARLYLFFGAFLYFCRRARKFIKVLPKKKWLV